MTDYNFGLLLIGLIVLVGGICTNSTLLFLFGTYTFLHATNNEIEKY